MTEEELYNIKACRSTGVALPHHVDILLNHIRALESELTAKDRQHMMTVNGLVEQLDRMKEVEQILVNARRQALELENKVDNFNANWEQQQLLLKGERSRAEQAEQHHALLRTALKKAHGAMFSWFSSEYAAHPLSAEVSEVLRQTVFLNLKEKEGE